MLNIETLSDSYTPDLALVAEKIKLRLNEYQQHAACLSQKSPFLPSRVIDVGFEGDLNSKLHITSSNFDDIAPYIALSYVWVVTQTFVASTENWLDLTNGFPLAALPKTIQDAIAVTRSLGIRYIWVDALCILQDSEADKAIEIKAMSSIYQNAVLTISAACGQSAQYGFLRSYPPKRLSKLNIILPDDTLGTVWFYAVDSRLLSNRVPPTEPIESRAWTLQEALLSPRIIYYASDGILWNCQTIQSESAFIFGALDANRRAANLRGHQESPVPLITRLPSSTFVVSTRSRKRGTGYSNPDLLGVDSIYKTWFHLVENYSARQCTFADDRLPALAGIATQMHKTGVCGAYLAGMWENKIFLQLGWAVIEAHPESRDQNYTAALSRLPTWCWASFPGQISFKIRPDVEEDA